MARPWKRCTPLERRYAVLSLAADGEAEQVHAHAHAGEAGGLKTERKPLTPNEYARLVSGWMLATSAPVSAEALAEPPRESGSRGSPGMA